MSNRLVVLGVIVILFTLYIYFVNKHYQVFEINKEGFEDSLETKIQQRFNPLAAQQNPLTNPAAPIGLSEGEANILTTLTEAALNKPIANPTGSGSFSYTENQTPITPRIDNENSLLGVVKFCKEQGSKANPFSDPKFAENCGVCLSEGSLITGETFKKPTGVVVYKPDKEKAIKLQEQNGHIFPRIIPSLNAGVCKGASPSEDALPVLAITEKDFNNFKKREACIHGSVVGNGCGMCQTNKQFSWVDLQGGMQGISIVLYGMGTFNIQVGGKQVGQGSLSETQGAVLQIGRVAEGTGVRIEVSKGTTMEGPYLYGALVSKNPNGKPYRIAIERIILKDTITGSTPRTGRAKVFTDVSLMLKKIMSSPQSERMVLEGQIPLTFVEEDQLAAFDCPAGPFITQQGSAELLIEDPCLKPSGQSPGNYSDGCLRDKLEESGCTAEGDLYKSVRKEAGNMTLAAWKTYVQGIAAQDGKTVKETRLCSGKDLTTPCDKYLGTDTVPDKECMEFLYNNVGVKSSRAEIGSSYTSAPTKFVADTTYSRENGTLNPKREEAYGELATIARNSYKGKKGIEAVKLYISDVYSKAVGDLDPNISDAEGGKRDSIIKIFGIQVVEQIGVKAITRNALGQVSDSPLTQPRIFPRSFNPKQNTQIGTVFMTGDYVMTFKIKIIGRPSQWTNILRIGNGQGDCCAFGQRAPAIFLHPDLYLHLRIGSTQDGNWGIDTQRLSLNQEVKFTLTCVKENVTIEVGDRVFRLRQPGTRPTGTFFAFISDNFYPAANCEITEFNLEIK